MVADLLQSGAQQATASSSSRPTRATKVQGLHLEDRLEAVEDRLDKLEGVERRGASLCEDVKRLREELAAGVKELNTQLVDRLRELEAWQRRLDEEVRKTTVEALQTCTRLADDSMGVSEATQLKVGEVKEWAEAKIAQLTLELADFRRSGQPLPREEPSAKVNERQPEPAGAPLASEAAIDSGARRLLDELSGQVWKIGTALRRVVTVQREQLQVHPLPRRPRQRSLSREAPEERHQLIVELHEELRRLEDSLAERDRQEELCRACAIPPDPQSRLRATRVLSGSRSTPRMRRPTDVWPVVTRGYAEGVHR